MVCNTFIDDDTIRAIKATVEVPVVYTVVSEKVDLESKLAAGIDFVNVSGADRTPAIVAEIRARYPELPVIATGGPTEETILSTIAAGANAITFTPPSPTRRTRTPQRKRPQMMRNKYIRKATLTGGFPLFIS